VPDGIPWAHPHIAGPAFNERAAFGHTPRVAPAPPYGPWYGWPEDAPAGLGMTPPAA
jgi:hypothetical protein